jgi:hypothetical protein
MTIDDLDLPYGYSENTQGGTLTTVAVCVAASAVMLALNFFNITNLSGYLVAAPIAMIVFRGWVYSLIRNGVHAAVRQAESDSKLDAIVQEAIDAKKRVGLTPGFLDARLLETA